MCLEFSFFFFFNSEYSLWFSSLEGWITGDKCFSSQRLPAVQANCAVHEFAAFMSRASSTGTKHSLSTPEAELLSAPSFGCKLTVHSHLTPVGYSLPCLRISDPSWVLSGTLIRSQLFLSPCLWDACKSHYSRYRLVVITAKQRPVRAKVCFLERKMNKH